MKTFATASLALLACLVQATCAEPYYRYSFTRTTRTTATQPTATGGSSAPPASGTACASYTLINARGTGEAQGQSSAFRTMNSNVLAARSGGSVYNVVYPAGSNQDSSQATNDIVNQVNRGVAANPNACFVLEGYSQGAAGTVNALSRLTGTSFTAVKGVFLVGDPLHKSGLTCNVDNNGGTTTRNVNGLSARGSAGIPSNWISKTLDVCIYGDGVCDTTHGQGINQQHLQYPRDTPTQNLGTQFITTVLSGQTYAHA